MIPIDIAVGKKTFFALFFVKVLLDRKSEFAKSCDLDTFRYCPNNNLLAESTVLLSFDVPMVAMSAGASPQYVFLKSAGNNCDAVAFSKMEKFVENIEVSGMTYPFSYNKKQVEVVAGFLQEVVNKWLEESLCPWFQNCFEGDVFKILNFDVRPVRASGNWRGLDKGGFTTGYCPCSTQAELVKKEVKAAYGSINHHLIIFDGDEAPHLLVNETFAKLQSIVDNGLAKSKVIQVMAVALQEKQG
ncbi:MAG: hypothetical protein PHT88_00590 [Candidatus Moranbacteria bacterium]|nr:hypothetical protein [Candidatus Moranbacteria bacterium]